MVADGMAGVWGGAGSAVRLPVCDVRYDSWPDLDVQSVVHTADLGLSAGGRRESCPHWGQSWGRKMLARRKGPGSGTGEAFVDSLAGDHERPEPAPCSRRWAVSTCAEPH